MQEILCSCALHTAKTVLQTDDPILVSTVLNLCQPFLHLNVASVLPTISPTATHPNKFINLLVCSFSSLISYKSREILNQFLFDHMEEIDLAYLLVQFTQNLPYNLPINICEYPLESGAVTQRVMLQYAECTKQLQENEQQKLSQMITYDLLFKTCVKYEAFKHSDVIISDHDIVQPAIQKIQQLKLEHRATRAQNIQLCELLKSWQNSEEGQTANELFKQQKRIQVLGPNQHQHDPSRYPIRPPEELINQFTNDNDDEDEDRVQHFSSFTNEGENGIIDVSNKIFNYSLIVTKMNYFNQQYGPGEFKIISKLINILLKYSMGQINPQFYAKRNVTNMLLSASFQYLIHLIFATTIDFTFIEQHLTSIITSENIKLAVLTNKQAENNIALDNLDPIFKIPFVFNSEYLELLSMLTQYKQSAVFAKFLIKIAVFKPLSEPSDNHIIEGVENICKVIFTLEAVRQPQIAIEFGFRCFACEYFMSQTGGPDVGEKEAKLIREMILQEVEARCEGIEAFLFFAKGFKAIGV
ncbi:Hypothetical_protein [Hexamita inflata]|uniref:Hypothetical_protein n=1 Tax=Hexamita inflata TaxID=28002 RepID=A0AA86U8R3_9EUKA|nr:Hypothetical protein HINF_LOCUS33299 [Hexamita inflata]